MPSDLDRVLGREHEERVRDDVGLTADRDLALLHHLQERALHLRRCPIDLVGQQEVGEDRAERGVELTGLLVVDPRADQIGRDEIRGELDPLEHPADRARKRLDRHRLRETGNALHEDVTPRQQRDDQSLEQMVLSDDDLLDLVEHLLHGLVAYRIVHVVHPLYGRVYGLVYRLGPPAPPLAVSMGTANPTPTKKFWPDGFASAVTMPTT